MAWDPADTIELIQRAGAKLGTNSSFGAELNLVVAKIEQGFADEANFDKLGKAVEVLQAQSRYRAYA